MAALEDRIAADLDAGHGRALVAELTQLVAAEPLRERLRALLIRALYQAGRQADALAVYRAPALAEARTRRAATGTTTPPELVRPITKLVERLGR